MTCFVSTGCFTAESLHEIIALCIQNGLDLEMSSSVPFSPDNVCLVKKAKENLRLLVHNYFPPPSVPFVLNLASTDPEVHRSSIELCRYAIRLCGEIGAPFYSVHAGFALHLNHLDLGNPRAQGHISEQERIPRERAYETFLATIRKLSSFADDENVELLVENNVVAVENIARDGANPLLLSDPDEIRTFFNDLSLPNVGLLLDTGHAKVSAATLGISPERYLEELAPLIRCLHLSDNDGRRDTNLPITAEAWFAPFLAKLATVPMVIEAYRISMEKILQQRQLVRRLSNQTYDSEGAHI